MPSDRDVTETVRAVLAQCEPGEKIHSGLMAVVFSKVLQDYGDRRSPQELRAMILVEAAHLGIRAFDAPH
jgi:hypothetical protein